MEYPFAEKTMPFSSMFWLSNKVKIQNRVAFDIFMMLGEVGGLYDFILLVITSLFSVFS